MSLPFQAEKASAGCFFTENIVLFDVVSTSGRFASNERSIQPQRAVDSAASTARFSLNDRMMIRGGQRLLWFLKKARGLLKKCFGESVKRIRAFDVNAGTFF